MSNRKDELRPVLVRQKSQVCQPESQLRGYFHTWGTISNDERSLIKGVVELEDDFCAQVDVEDIKFLDR